MDLTDKIVEKLVEEFGFSRDGYDIINYSSDEITFCGGNYDFCRICDFICDNFNVKNCEFYYEIDGGIVSETRIEIEN